MHKINPTFFQKDVLEVAPFLLGKKIVCSTSGKTTSHIITEVEAYRGEEDKACHASKGRTKRTEVMFRAGGILYIYLIYGMYYMLNIVTGKKENPQAVLIRGIENFDGPGKLTKALQIDKSYNGEDLATSDRIWIENGLKDISYHCYPRVGIDYAGEEWKNKPWRFVLQA